MCVGNSFVYVSRSKFFNLEINYKHKNQKNYVIYSCNGVINWLVSLTKYPSIAYLIWIEEIVYNFFLLHTSYWQCKTLDLLKYSIWSLFNSFTSFLLSLWMCKLMPNFIFTSSINKFFKFLNDFFKVHFRS